MLAHIQKTASFIGFLCLVSLYTFAQNTTRPNVTVPNGFEVNSYTGNLYHSRADMKIPGQGLDIDITFSYNFSRRNKNWGMGKGWTFTYNMAYATDANGVWIERADGRRDYYKKSGGAYTPPAGVYDALLEYQSGKFSLQTKENLRYYFDNNTHKRLTKLEDAAGNLITIAYADTLIKSVTDNAGHIIDFTWLSGRLTEITDNSCSTPRKVTYDYDTKGNPTKVTNPVGDFVRYYYDPTPKIIGYTDEGGNNMSISYNSNNAVVKITSCITTHTFTYIPAQSKTFVNERVNGQSTVTTYVFDSEGRVITKKGNCCGYNVDYTYDAQNNIINRADGNKKQTQYTYDANGNITKETDPAGNFTTFNYNLTTNKVTSMTDKNGNTTSFQYDAKGNVTLITKPLNVTEKYTYDAKGNKLSYTDGNNNVTNYEYDTKGYLTKITDPEGGITSYTYDCYGNRLTETNPRQFTTTYQYNALNQLVKVKDALNGVTSYTYNKLGQIATVTNPLGKTTQYQYDGLGRRISTTLPLGNTTRTDYDEQGNIIKETDANGNATTYTYNQRNQPLSKTDALGNSMFYEYDEAGNKTGETDKNGNKTRFEYDIQYRLIKRIDALGGTTQYSYDAVGNRIAEIDANGNATSYDYDALQRVTKITDPLGKSQQFTYDSNGNRLTEKDKNGNTTGYTYDKLNRVKTVTNALGGIMTYTYDANGNVLTEKNPLNHTTTYTYTKLDRRLTVTNPLNEVTSYTYDANGNEKTVSLANGNSLTKSYDENNRIINISDDLGLIYTYTYDSNNNLLTEKDANNNTTKSNEYDALNRKAKVKDGLGSSVIIEYDANSNLTKIVDRNANPKTYTYDVLNRKISEKDALGNTTRFTYDAVGNQLSVLDAKGNSTSYIYDVTNQLIRETYPNGTYNAYTYDNNGNRKTRRDASNATTTFSFDALNRITKRSYPNATEDIYSYDLAGRRLTANNANASISFTYDAAGKMLTETLNGKTTTYSYNATNRTRTITYPGNRVITEERGKREQLLTIKEGTNTISTLSYDAANRLTGKSFGNGYSINYGYNQNNWLTTLNCQPNNSLEFTYTYDKVGNKISVSKKHRTTHSEKYVYDKINQLIGFHTGKLTNDVLTDTTFKSLYSLDALHNRIVSNEGGIVKNYTSNNLNQITSINQNNQTTNLNYDTNGNLKNDGLLTYSYDYENRVRNVNDAAVQHFYDAVGRRIKTIANGTETNYFFAQNRIIEERNAQNTVLKTYIYGVWLDDIIAYSTATTTYYLVNNLQGTVLAALNNTGIVENYEYDGTGNVKFYNTTFNQLGNSSINNTSTFTGRPFLETQKQYDFRARIYNPNVGTFLQRDPLAYVDGFNLYTAYFLPNNIDPFGLNTGGAKVCFNNPRISKDFEIPLPKGLSLGTTFSIETRSCEETYCCNGKEETGFIDQEAKINANLYLSIATIKVDNEYLTGWLGATANGSVGAGQTYKIPNSKCGIKAKNSNEGICINVYGNFLFAIGGSLELKYKYVNMPLEFTITDEVTVSADFCWANIKDLLSQTKPRITNGSFKGNLTFKANLGIEINFDFLSGEIKFGENSKEK